MDSDPRVALADLSTETGRNVQAGFRVLFMAPREGSATRTPTSCSRRSMSRRR